jgi:hypothetical protein
MRAPAVVWLLLLALGGCGDKVPQSEASKRAGEMPKQVVDKATDDTTRALQQGAAPGRQAD